MLLATRDALVINGKVPSFLVPHVIFFVLGVF